MADTTMEAVQSTARQALTGERVRLRELRETDLPTLVSWWRVPEVAVFNAHVQPRPDKPLEEMFRAWSDNGTSAGAAFCVETVPTAAAELSESRAPIGTSGSDNSAAGELVGHVSLWGAEVRNRCATFGILIGPEYQSRGIGTEATRLMVDYGFGELGLHRIELMVNAENLRGIAAYRRAGFEQEGLLRSKLFFGGRFHDQVCMAALSPYD